MTNNKLYFFNEKFTNMYKRMFFNNSRHYFSIMCDSLTAFGL